MWSLWHSQHNRNACSLWLPLSLSLSLSASVCIRIRMRVRMRKASQRRRVKLQAHMCSEFNLFRQHGERLPTTWKTISACPHRLSQPSYFFFGGKQGNTNFTWQLHLQLQLAWESNEPGFPTQNNVLNAENEIQGSSQTSPSLCLNCLLSLSLSLLKCSTIASASHIIAMSLVFLYVKSIYPAATEHVTSLTPSHLTHHNFA